MRLARELKIQRQRDRLMMIKQGLTRRTPEPGESFKGVVEKVVQRGQDSYAILIEYDARGTPTSFVVLDQPQAVRAFASLDKDDPKLEYARRPVLELRQGERLEVYGQRVVSGKRDASQKLDDFKRALHQKERESERELNPKRSKGPDWGR